MDLDSGPLQHTLAFWKPLIDSSELASLARYADSTAEPRGGIDARQPPSAPARYTVLHGQTRFSLFSAVERIDSVPEAAEVVAEIRGEDDLHHSYVLWYPSTRSITVPFDPNAAIEALLYERYVSHKERTALPRMLLSAYYALLKPWLPPRARFALRRVLARRSFAKGPLLDWPDDDSLDRLQRFMLGLVMTATGRSEVEFCWFWPDGRPWAAILTHDVETSAGLAGIDRIIQLERDRGMRSSFNLVPVDYAVPESLIRELQQDGFEVGVHGYTHDGRLFSSWEEFARRLPTINEFSRRLDASGFRSPATYRNPDWFHFLDFEYDSSMSDSAPFEPQAGGCASQFPFQIGDGMLELPMTVSQDHTLFGVLGETSAQTWLTELHSVKLGNALACILTHPDPYEGYVGAPGNDAHYERLLDAIGGSDAWVPLPRELARWWRHRLVARPAQFADSEGGSLGKAVLGRFGQIQVVAPAVAFSRVPATSPRRASRRPVRVWVDMANSPHVQFFAPIISEIEARGHSVLITARDFAQTLELLDEAGLSYTAIGQHGGKTSIGKLLAIEHRARALAAHARRHGVDVAVHHNSYAQSFAAWSMRIPSMTLMDYEHQPANHVSFRLSDTVFMPESIPRRAVGRYGVAWRLRRYPGLKEDFYVASMVGGGSADLGVDGVDPTQALLILRPPPDLAVYHRVENVLWGPLLRYLADQPGVQALVVPRTREQAARLTGQASRQVLIAEHAIPPATLLLHGDGVITAGGTMAREAAALGIPAYTVFAGQQGEVDASLIRQGRLVDIRSADDFGRIRTEKLTRHGHADVAAERERVRWLVDLIVEAAGTNHHGA